MSWTLHNSLNAKPGLAAAGRPHCMNSATKCCSPSLHVELKTQGCCEQLFRPPRPPGMPASIGPAGHFPARERERERGKAHSRGVGQTQQYVPCAVYIRRLRQDSPGMFCVSPPLPTCQRKRPTELRITVHGSTVKKDYRLQPIKLI